MKREEVTIVHVVGGLAQSVSAWTFMRLMKVVRTRNLHMYSKASLVEPDWEIDSIPMATAAAKYVSCLSPAKYFPCSLWTKRLKLGLMFLFSDLRSYGDFFSPILFVFDQHTQCSSLIPGYKVWFHFELYFAQYDQSNLSFINHKSRG